MTAQCTIHNTNMGEHTSKTKFDEEGNPKTYLGHFTNGAMCFGEGQGKAVRNGRTDDITTEQATFGKRVDTKVEEKVDWDAKDRQSMAQTAMKSASEIVAAQLNAGLFSGNCEEHVKYMANEFYKELVKIKSIT